jgi:isopentenyl diphosphate isomerase/L-lactate dehydrogenase-like FMN-dependent dehydrogenase
MTARTDRHHATGTRTNRRRFFKLLAGSPLLALAYPTLTPDWLRALERAGLPRAASGPRPLGIPCANCGRDIALAAQSAGVALPGATPPDQDPDQFLNMQLAGQTIESPAEAVNVWDFEKAAHANNLPQHWAYIHMGVDDFETRRANREGFQRLQLRPRRLGPDVTKLDRSVRLLGRAYDSPLFLCPVAALEAYHTQGESGAARAARAKGVLQLQSHNSSQSYEQIAEARGEPHWFQIYTNVDWNVNKRLIDRVASAGCPTLVWTIDLLGGSNRELSRRAQGPEQYKRPLCQSCHNHQQGYRRPMLRGLEGPPGPRPPYTWDYVKRLKDATSMKLVLKGIVTREEAELAVEHGADGIFVSNHGGRAENSLRSTIECLPEVVAGAKGRVPVMIDSGVRRGGDIFKALALGADAVGIGRPYVWGLGAFGQEGVERVIDLLHAELNIVMRQARTPAIDQIGPQFVMEAKGAPIMMRHNTLGFGL